MISMFETLDIVMYVFPAQLTVVLKYILDLFIVPKITVRVDIRHSTCAKGAHTLRTPCAHLIFEFVSKTEPQLRLWHL